MARDYPARQSRHQGRGERYAEGRSRSGQSTGGQRQNPSYRLFVAVEIPDDAIRKLVGWQQQYLAADNALKLTPAEQLHITLVFLGQKDEKERELAAGQLDELESLRAFKVEAKRMVGLPKGKSHRVIAVECMELSGHLVAIHNELARGLAEKGLYKTVRRGFFPHVTVARVRGRSRSRIDLSEIHPEPVEFTAVRVSLYNSILREGGASHEALKTVQLT